MNQTGGFQPGFGRLPVMSQPTSTPNAEARATTTSIPGDGRSPFSMRVTSPLPVFARRSSSILVRFLASLTVRSRSRNPEVFISVKVCSDIRQCQGASRPPEAG